MNISNVNFYFKPAKWVTLGGFFGACLGVGVSMVITTPRISDLEATVVSLVSLNELQAQTFAAERQSNRQAAVVLVAPALISSIPVTIPTEQTPTKVVSAPPIQTLAVQDPAPAVVRVPPRRPGKVNPSNSSAVASRPVAAPTAPSPAASVSPAPALTASPIATTAPITLEQAGITGIDATGIRFKSGRQVSVGGEFPTGEKLLSVNPADGRIVTDRRVIVLTRPQN